MRVSALLVGIALLPALGSCSFFTASRPHAPFRITTDHASYAPSYVVAVTVVNVSGEDATYNFCPRALERRGASAWETVVRYPVSGACTAEARVLRAGESVETRLGLSSDLPNGTYRIVFPWLGNSTLPDEARATPSFVVAKLPVVALP